MQVPINYQEEARKIPVPELKRMALDIADEHGIPQSLFLGYFNHESKWNPVVPDPNGQLGGLGQITPSFWKDYGSGEPLTHDAYDPRMHPGKNMAAIARGLVKFREEAEAQGYEQPWQAALRRIGPAGNLASTEKGDAYLSQVITAADKEVSEAGQAKREGFGQAVTGLDVGPGLYPEPAGRPGAPAPGDRQERISQQQPLGLLETVKDYLGIKDTPAFLPVFDRDQGMWRAQERYQALKHFHSWEEPTELERSVFSWLNGPTFGTLGMLYRDKTGRDMPPPDSITGTLVSGVGSFAGLLGVQFPMAHTIIGTRLNPTREGIRRVAEIMHQSGTTFTLATTLSNLIPTLMSDDNLTEKGYRFFKSAAASYLVGALWPMLGAGAGVKEAVVSGLGAGEIAKRSAGFAVRLATSMAVLDFVRTRFEEAPDKGWFTMDDVYRGVLDGSIDRKVLAQKSFDYLVDLYFLSKTATFKTTRTEMKKGQLQRDAEREELKRNTLMAEGFKVNPQEAEDAIMDIAAARGGEGGGGEAGTGEKQPWEMTSAEFKYLWRQSAQTEQGIPLSGLKSEDARSWLGYEGQKTIKVFRASDVNRPIEAGDFVSMSPDAAKQYGKYLKEKEVPATDLRYMRGTIHGEPDKLDIGGQPELIYAPTKGELHKKLRSFEHRKSVEQALSRGLPVPPEVLAEYPEFAAKAKEPVMGEKAPAWKQGYELSGEEYISRYRALRESEATGRGGEAGTGGKEKTDAEILALREQDVIRAMKGGEAVPPHVQAEFAAKGGEAGRGGRGEPERAGKPLHELPFKDFVEAWNKEYTTELKNDAEGRRIWRNTVEAAIKKGKGIPPEVFDELTPGFQKKWRDQNDSNLEKYGLDSELRAEVKQPWELTHDEFVAQRGALPPHPEGGLDMRASKVVHREAVEKALSEGQSVPPEVLAEYPDLAAKGAKDLQDAMDQVKRAVPGIAEAQARLLAEDPALFTKVMQGNLSMEEARQLAEGRAHAAQEPQRALEGLEAPDSLFGYALKDPKNLYGGGPDVEYVKQYANKLTEFGGKMIDWADKHLERSLPPELKDKDASKNIGVLLMKIQQFEDISRTYPEAKPIFDAARAGLALKMRHSEEFYGFMVHYLQKLNPGERANVDKLLVDRDIINDLTWGLDFRLQDIDKFRSYLTNPWPEIREKGVAWYMREGLSRNEAEGAFGFRMAFDYAKALKMDYHTRAFQEWLAAHGIDPGKSKDILDMILHSEYKPEHIAESYFGPEPGKNIKTILENFRLNMQYWLKETNEYIPRTRYGDYFIRVFDRAVDTPLKVAARKFADAAEKHFGDLDPKEAEWLDAKGQSGVPKALKGVYQELRAAIKFADEHAERPKDGAALMTEALRLLNPVVHATAAASPAEYHRKVAELNEQFADPRYQVSAKLEKRLPIELFVEANIPKAGRIIMDAAEKVGGHNLKIKEAVLEDWRDFLATAKGSFGAHFVKRSDVLIPGYETDLMRPATDYLGGLAGYIGKMEKIRGFSEAYKEFPQNMPNLFKHMNDYTNYVLSNPYEFQGVRNLIYNWTLGGNLSFYLLNSLQNIHVGWAALGRVSKSPLKEIGGAYKDWTHYMVNGEGLRAGEEAALIKARYEPELAPSAASELSGKANNPLYRWLHNDPTSLASKGIDMVRALWYGTGIETMNRETMFLAAYRATGDFDSAIGLVRDAHFLYGKETRPSMFRGVGAVPGVFMTFSLNYFTLLKNFGKAVYGVSPETYGTRAEGAAGLARMTAGALMTAGLMGTALWLPLSIAYHKIFDSDLERDGKKWLDEQLHESPVAAETAHRLLFRGPLAAALGVDVSARVAPNVPFMNMPPGPARWQDLVGAVLGAGSIPLQRGFQVGAALSEGQTGRALEAAVPVSMAAPMAAHRLRTEGATTLSGRPIFTADGEPLKLTGWETAAKAVAFQPVRLAEHHKTERFARDREQDKKNQTQKYSGRLARAVRESDDKAFNDVIGEWTAYNNKMIAKGRLADVITPESVEAGVMSRFKPKFPDVSEKQMLLRQLSE